MPRMALPELTAPAESYYDKKGSKEYNENTRINRVQGEITSRALELLLPEENSLILDLGCGGGLSSQVLADYGHNWVGVDISVEMLNYAKAVSSGLSLVKGDFGHPLPFAKESFDYAISISAVQWLLSSYSKADIPEVRIRTFFRSLYYVIKRRAVLQFYCDRKGESIILNEAKKAGFYGGMMIDGENTKNEKRFLLIDKSKPKIPPREGNKVSSKGNKKKKQIKRKQNK